MDTIEQDRQTIEAVLNSHTLIPYAHDDIRIEAVFDSANDRYLLVNVGWDKKGRVHGTLVHVDLIDGKFWIQRDGTEEGIASELVRAGIPKQRIVLAFRRPEVRQFTDYAVA